MPGFNTPRRSASPQQRNAEIFLREIHQFKIQSERHRLIEGICWRQRRNFGRERASRGIVAGSSRFGALAQQLDSLKRLGSFESRDHPTQRTAERPHFSAQSRHFLKS
jgi:hypothetical protein